MKVIKALVEGVWREFEPDELKGKSGVYKWTSPDGFWYVGQSCDLYRRHREFMNFAGDYSGELVNLERYKCPNPDKWVYEILEFTETEFDNDELEEQYISKFDPLSRLNMKIGGGEFLKLLLRYMKPGFKLLYNDFWRKYSSFKSWTNYKDEMKFCIEHPAYEPIADEYKKLDKKVIELHGEFVKYRDILPEGELSNKQLVRIMLDYRSVDDNEIKSGLEKLFDKSDKITTKLSILYHEVRKAKADIAEREREEKRRIQEEEERLRKQEELTFWLPNAIPYDMFEGDADFPDDDNWIFDDNGELFVKNIHGDTARIDIDEEYVFFNKEIGYVHKSLVGLLHIYCTEGYDLSNFKYKFTKIILDKNPWIS